MKKKFKCLIGASILVASATIMTPLLTSCKEQTSSTSADDNSSSVIPGQGTFVDNTYNYSTKINNPNESSFNQNTDSNGWGDFSALTSNANSTIYDKIFASINENTVTNDIYNMISILGKHSKTNIGFDANVKNINVTNTDGTWNINIQFDLYNSLSKPNTYVLGAQNIVFNPKTKKDIDLNISGELKRTFFSPRTTELMKKLYFGYYFSNSTITYDNQTRQIGDFKLNNYSLSLNKYVEIQNNEVGYTDIEEFATQKMMNFTDENLQTEIANTYDQYLSIISTILDPLQKLLQELIKSNVTPISLLEFLKTNSENIGTILNEFYKLINKNGNIDLREPVRLILSNAKLSELIVNENTKKLIITILNKYQPGIAATIKPILDNINSINVDQQLEAIFNIINTIIGGENQNITKLISDLKTKGILVSIWDNKQFFIDIIKKTTNNEQDPIIELISLITKTAEANTSNDPFDFVLNLIKMKNDNGSGSGEYILKDILTKLIPNQTILTILEQILFDNPHLTKENMIGLIDVFANPRKTKDKNGEIVNLKTWFDSITKTKVFSKENEHIKFTYKFQFQSDIYFNIDKLFKALPNTLSIGTTSIPVGILVGALPDWISINNGDYIEVQQVFDNVEYDVVNINGQYKLSWQSFAHTTVDINLPNSLKTIYDSTLIAGSTFVSLLNNVFYGIYNTSSYFKPYKSSLNEFAIDNYNPKLKNNEAIFTNTLTQEKLAEISKAINDSITEEVVPGTEFEYANSWLWGKQTVNKNKTICTFDIYSLLTEYFNLDNYNSPFHVNIDINKLIRGTSVATYQIPEITIKNIAIQTPYYVYTDGGEFKNYFSINF
ncbi:MAG: hypothetical protein H9897_00925 [Candidatus Ureaplasma intestinipullorum]|uniref:Lipoprotein n=1 Tax=Candidatus Ureaplasma intestinipullorum TaxID=2838770 RepID=A0A9E2KWG8_9BACT|nr:hypothetical protein [Candidatus Ureaplasma intestinipullorum]